MSFLKLGLEMPLSFLSKRSHSLGRTPKTYHFLFCLRCEYAFFSARSRYGKGKAAASTGGYSNRLVVLRNWSKVTQGIATTSGESHNGGETVRAKQKDQWQAGTMREQRMTNNLYIKEAPQWSTLGEKKKVEPMVAGRGRPDLIERAWILELHSLRFKFQV